MKDLIFVNNEPAFLYLQELENGNYVFMLKLRVGDQTIEIVRNTYSTFFEALSDFLNTCLNNHIIVNEKTAGVYDDHIMTLDRLENILKSQLKAE